MSSTTITEDGWTRDFLPYGRDLKEMETEAKAYEEGIHDAAPGQYETEWSAYDEDLIQITVRKKDS